MRHKKVGVLVVVMSLVGLATVVAQGDRTPAQFVKIQLRSGQVYIGQLISETNDEVRWEDLVSEEINTRKKSDLINFQKGLSPDDIVNRIGFPVYASWQIKRALGTSNRTGRVVEWSGGRGKIDIGRRRGLKLGDSVRVVRPADPGNQPGSADLEGGEAEVVTEVEVVEVGENAAAVEARGGLGGEPLVGDLAKVVDRGKVVAVVPPKLTNGEPSPAAERFASAWTTMLQERGVTVVERAALEKVIRERANQSDPRDLGRLLKASAVVTGTITPGPGMVQIRLIDVQSGEVLFTADRHPEISPALKKALMKKAYMRKKSRR